MPSTEELQHKVYPEVYSSVFRFDGSIAHSFHNFHRVVVVVTIMKILEAIWYFLYFKNWKKTGMLMWLANTISLIMS